MPDIITIIFDCNGPTNIGIRVADPSRLDESEKCIDAYEKLLDFLYDHHISYFVQDANRDEIRAEEERLISLKAKEYAP